MKKKKKTFLQISFRAAHIMHMYIVKQMKYSFSIVGNKTVARLRMSFFSFSSTDSYTLLFAGENIAIHVRFQFTLRLRF